MGKIGGKKSPFPAYSEAILPLRLISSRKTQRKHCFLYSSPAIPQFSLASCPSCSSLQLILMWLEINRQLWEGGINDCDE